MFAVTRQTSALAITILLVTIIATTIRLYLNPFSVEVAESPFMPQWWHALLSGLMLFVSAIVINRATVKIGIFGGFSALPVSVFGFVSCGILLSPNMVVASATTLLMALGIMHLFRSVHLLYDKEHLFTASLLFGVMPLIYPPTLPFVLILLIAIFIVPFSFRQTIIALVGYLVPFATASYIHWYVGGDIIDVALNIWHSLITPAVKITLEPLPIVTAAIVVVLLLVLIYGFMVNIYNRYAMIVPVRKAVQLSIWIFTIGAATFAALPGCGITVLQTAAVPTTILAAFALDRMESKLANIFYLSLVILLIVHLFFY